jgi:hypothetical protein
MEIGSDLGILPFETGANGYKRSVKHEPVPFQRMSHINISEVAASITGSSPAVAVAGHSPPGPLFTLIFR